MATAETTTQTCYRHPDRETRVSCSNCGRPICPDCMTPTPVGMRCPECARQKTKVIQGSGGIFSATGEPYATYVIVGLCVVAFLAEIASGGQLFGGTLGTLGGNGALNAGAVADGEWWRLVTSGFLHDGIVHLALNMFLLYVLGTMLEPLVGTPRFVGIYVVSLLAGALGALVVSGDAGNTVGASGALFGMFAAAFLIARARRLESVASQIGLLIVLNLFFTFSVSGISIGGHLGGLAGGALAGWLIIGVERWRGRQSGLWIELGAFAALSVAAVVASIAVATSVAG